MLKVKDLMQKEVKTISGDAKVSKAVQMMIDYNISCLVIEKKGYPVGIITERDIIHKGFPYAKVKKIMSSPAIVVKPDISILEASILMKHGHVKQIPVVEDHKTVGILTQTDIIHNFYDSYYLVGFSRREMVVAFLIFLLMLYFLPVIYALLFMGFVVFSQINVCLHFLGKR